MSIKIIFEDSKDTPSSKLLSSCFNGINIFFSDGIAQMLNMLKKVYDNEDIILLMFDFVPNNRATYHWYDNILAYIEEQEYDNVYAVPIICIEYFILKFFNDFNYMALGKDKAILAQNLIYTFNWASVPSEYKSKSLEHIYKFLVSAQNLICLHNRNKDRNFLSGRFYKENCDCDRKYCKINCEDDIGLKSERLYTSLPFFEVVSDEHRDLLNDYNIQYKGLSLEDLKFKEQAFYDMIFDSMDLPNVKILLQ